MTRNNLADHLTWLLHNTSLVTPNALDLPSNTDPLSLQGSQSQPRSSGSSDTSRNALNRPGAAVNSHPGPRGSTTTRHIAANVGDESTSIAGVTLDDATMGRMTATASSRKPSLVSKFDQLPTPAPTTETKLSRTPRAAPAVKPSPPLSQKKLRISPPKSVKTRRSSSPHAAAELPAFQSSDFDCMDLTSDKDVSSDSVQFGKDTKVWCEDSASRPGPLPKKSKKRKSSDISKDEFSDAEEDFPDIYRLLGETPPAVTPKNKSSARKRDTIKKSTQKRDTVKRLKSPAETHLEDRSSPLIQKAAREPSVAPQQEPQTASPARKTQVAEPASKLTSASFEEWLGEGAGGEFEEDVIIPDSDDEFLTPPSHNTSAAPRDPPATFERGPSRGQVTRESQERRSNSPLPQVSPSRPAPTHAPSHLSNSQTIASPHPPVDLFDVSLASSGDKIKLLGRLSTNPDAVKAKCESLDRQILHNDQSFRRAIDERAPKERRNQIKAAKERLLKQQRCLRELAEPLESYRKLCDQRETLAKQVAQSYVDGLDTDEDETRLDRLTDEVQEMEESLLKSLAEAGVDDQTPPSSSQPPAPPSSTARDIIVPDTQPSARFTVNMSQHSKDPPANIVDAAPDIIHQTQVSAQSRIWNEPLSTTKVDSRSGMLSQDEGLSEAPFPRRSRDEVTTASYTPTFKPPARPAAPPINVDMDVPEDLFSEIDDIDICSLPRSAKKPSLPPPPSRNQPPKSRNMRPPDDFSDFSDDAEILALAQDYESRHSTVGSTQPPPRRTFSEISGNAGVTPPTNRAAKKQHPAPSASGPLIPPHLMTHPWSPEVQKKLKDRFRMKGFRHNQLEAINATLAGDDAFVLMPTGGGKSLCYQLPAVVRTGKTRGMTIVVSPLLSLMQDQVDHMKALGIQAVAFNSECSAEYKRQVLSAFDERNPENFVELLYVTPEMVSKSTQFDNAMQTLYRKGKFARLVIDEAHCVSQWGHDFRPDYKMIGRMRSKFPEVPIMALTATATQNVIVDIKHNLGMPNCQVFSQSFNRPNLYYEVRPKTTNASALTSIASLIKSNYRGVSGIIYTISRKQAEAVAAELTSQGITARHYHAGIDPAEKVEVQTSWQRGAVKVVVATIAFGMGIDKPDVRFVIHHGIPKSLEGYYQETGRAGRDGNPSDCILYFGKADIRVLKKLILDGDGSFEQRERQMSMLNRVTAFCENKADCRRTEILRYFGEEFERSDCGKSCDNCRAGLVFEEQDFSTYATAAIEVIKVQRKLTAAQAADILLGKKYPDTEEHLSDRWYGSAKGLKKHEVVRIIDKLYAEKAFTEYNQVNRHGLAIQYLNLGPMAKDFLFGRQKLMLTIQVDEGSQAKTTKSRATKKTSKKGKEKDTPALQSTYVSSPVERRRRDARRNRAAESDEEEEFPVTAHGYENDGFVVSDEQTDDEQDEEAFAPPPRHHPAKPPSAASRRTPGPPIPTDTRIEDLPELHQDMVYNFLQEAQRWEEQVRNKKELRRPLFTERDLREMAINWTTSLDKMSRIPGVDRAKVKEHGPKLLIILRRYHSMYKEMTGSSNEAPASPSRDQDIVDLISSDAEMDMDEDEDDDAAHESHYFNNPSSRPEVQAFHSRLQGLSDAQPSSAGNRSRASSSSRGGRKWSGGGGGRKWQKKGSGGTASRRKVSGNSASAGPSGARRANSAAPKRDGKIVKKSGGGIGLMPM